LRKPKARSEFYFRHPKIMSSEDRLDYTYWHPKFENLIALLASSKFEIKELSSIVRAPIVSGKTPKNYVYPMKGVLFIGSRNVRNGWIDLTDVTYIEEAIHNSFLKSSKVSPGDILVTMAGAVGRCAMYDDLERNANINQAVARIQPNVEEINPKYLVYYLNSSHGQIQFERNKHDVNQPNINTTEIGRIKVIRPPKELQSEIVGQISDVENEIAQQTYRQQSVLRDLRNVILSEYGLTTPSIECDYYIQPFEALGERFDFVWNHPTTRSVKQYLKYLDATPLGSIVEDEFEYGINALGKEKGRIPFVNIEQVNPDGTIHSDGIKYVDDVSPRKLLKPNDVLICRSRAVGTCALVTTKEKNYTFGSFILRVRLKENANVSPQYIVSFINSNLGQIQIKFLQTGSEKFAFTKKLGRGGGNNVNPDQLKKLMIVLPKTSKQQDTIISKIKQLLKDKENIEARVKKKIDSYNKAFEKLLAKLEKRWAVANINSKS
jgi:type I restriction enzyme S subunit